jgi:hypothetical protein
MHHYWVVSPEMSEIVPVLDTGEGPTEYFHCVVPIEAETAADAKVLALKDPEMEAWIQEARSDGHNPLIGLKAEVAYCPHGICSCCHDGCEKCDLEYATTSTTRATRK